MNTNNHPEWGTDNFFRKATLDEVRALLARGLDPNRTFADGATAMHNAARATGDPGVIGLLARAGAAVDARDMYRQDTPLHHAASWNANPGVVAALVEAGAEVDARNVLERTPLLVAAERSRHPDVVAALLEAGANPQACSTRFFTTALHFAAMRNEREYSFGKERPIASDIVALLLAAGIDPDGDDKDGETPLHKAARCAGQTGEVVRQLLAAGADPNALAKDGDGRRPLHWAVEQFAGRPMAVRHLLQAGADPNGLEIRHGTSPLFWTNSPESVAMLLAAGADPNLVAKGRGDTPLVRAVRMTQHEDFDLAAVSRLVEAGADPNIPDTFGRTALHYAVADGSSASVGLLLAAGADLTVEDQFGDTPLSLAEKQLDDEGLKYQMIAVALARTPPDEDAAPPEPGP